MKYFLEKHTVLQKKNLLPFHQLFWNTNSPCNNNVCLHLLHLFFWLKFFFFQGRSLLNGIQHSPQQLPQNLSSVQQSKTSINGIKPNLRYQNQQSANTTSSNLNGRKPASSETQLDKQHDSDNAEKGLPVFVKPFKIPTQPDHSMSKNRIQTTTDHSSSQNDGGKDVESILKMMTSTLEPLTKIAATPRTDIDVQTPNKPYVYANLPPLLRAPAVNCNKSMLKLLFFYKAMQILHSRNELQL